MPEDNHGSENKEINYEQIAIEDAERERTPAKKRLFIFTVSTLAYVRLADVIETTPTTAGKEEIETPWVLFYARFNEEFLLWGLGFIIFFFFARYFWHEFMFLISVLRGDTHTTHTARLIGFYAMGRDIVVWLALYLILPLKAMHDTNANTFCYALILLTTLVILFGFFCVYEYYRKQQNRKGAA